MAEAAVKLEEPLPQIRHFNEADLCKHTFIMPRLRERFPHHNERSLATYLRGLFFSNEHLFLYSDYGCALAQVIKTFSLDAEPVVQERFVWAADPKNALHIAACAEFYTEIERWAKLLGVNKIFVEEWSDVPHEKVRERLGRIFTQQISFARV